MPGAPARTVTDTHDDYYNLAPSQARFITSEGITFHAHWLNVVVDFYILLHLSHVHACIDITIYNHV